MPLFRSKAEQKLVERGLDPARLVTRPTTFPSSTSSSPEGSP